MAKKKSDVNKAAEIRAMLTAHPEMKGVEIVEALKKKGIVVSPAQVSNVKNASGKKAGKKRGPKSKGRLAAVGAAIGVAASVAAGLAFVKAVGGAEEAKKLIDALRKGGATS